MLLMSVRESSDTVAGPTTLDSLVPSVTFPLGLCPLADLEEVCSQFCSWLHFWGYIEI